VDDGFAYGIIGLLVATRQVDSGVRDAANPAVPMKAVIELDGARDEHTVVGQPLRTF
jgi:hypothetical protein